MVPWKSFTFVMSRIQCKRKKKYWPWNLKSRSINVKSNTKITWYRHPRVQNHKVAVSTHTSPVLNDQETSLFYFSIEPSSCNPWFLPWKISTFVISRMQYKKNYFNLEIQGQDQFCGRFFTNSFVTATDKFFFPPCIYDAVILSQCF